jgi:hypothetical protein
VLELEVDPEKVNLGGLTRAIADLSRASVSGKKYAAEVKSRATAAAEAVGSITKKAGMSADVCDKIRREILGIA